ncbi:MAG: peptide ABC transporter substrate-binding protein, partial [Thermoplasmata archaeon]
MMTNTVEVRADQMANSAQARTVSRADLVYPLEVDPPTLDINRAGDTTSHMVLGQLMEGLYRYRPDGTIEPAGATDYTVSPDGLVYTVTLRTDALWSDGQPVTAQHYKDSIVRLLDPDTGAGNAFMMYPIAGAEEFNTGVITDPNAVGVTAVDTYTLLFTLEEAAGFFPDILATTAAYPGRLDIIQSDPNWTEPGHFVGNGP